MKTKTTLAIAAILAAFALTLPLVIGTPGGSGGSSGSPANKASAVGSTIQHVSSDVTDSDAGLTVLSTTVKVGGPKDLILHLSMECSIWTRVSSTTIANHPLGYTSTASAQALMLVWIEVDGQRVPVASGDDGKVAFCERVHEQTISDMDDSTGNFTITQFQKTRNANAFNWVSLDVGSGTHTIEVKVDIQASNTEGGYAEGAVGKRTLVIDPANFANGATI